MLSLEIMLLSLLWALGSIKKRSCKTNHQRKYGPIVYDGNPTIAECGTFDLDFDPPTRQL